METIGGRRAVPAATGENYRSAPTTSRAETLTQINRVKITGPQMRAAIDTIAHIPVRTAEDAREHRRLLDQFATDYGFIPPRFAGAALHLRAIAMDRWCHRYDPNGQTDVDAFYEAGARATMVDSAEGPAFEPERFKDLVAFFAEMPF